MGFTAGGCSSHGGPLPGCEETLGFSPALSETVGLTGPPGPALPDAVERHPCGPRASGQGMSFWTCRNLRTPHIDLFVTSASSLQPFLPTLSSWHVTV